MTLEYLQYSIGEIALKNNLVNWYGTGGSLYEINGETVRDYPLVFITASGDHTVYENVTRYTLTIYYMDRLLDDNSNETNVHSVAVETLKNLYRQIPMISWVDGIQLDPRIRLFSEVEKMDDRVAGGYMTVWVDVLNPSTCPVYFDETGYPLGNWLPDGVTKNVLENLASKPWVIEQIAKLEQIDPSVVEALISDLANYTQTKDFATINGDRITEGGNFELTPTGTTQQVIENVSSLSAWTADQQEQIDALSGKTNDLQEQIDNIDFSPYATTAQTADIQSQVDDLSGKTNDLQDQIDNLDFSPYATTATTESLQGQIDTLTGETHDLDVRVTDLENEMLDCATTGDTAYLQTQIDTLTGQTSELSASTVNIYNQLTATTENLESQISGLTNSKQDKVTAGWGLSFSGATLNEDAPVFHLFTDLRNVGDIGDWFQEYGYQLCVVLYKGYALCISASDPTKPSWYGGGFKCDYMTAPQYKYMQVLFDDGQLYETEYTVDPRDYLTSGDTLTAGTGITIQNNVISVTAPVVQSNQITNIWSGTQQAYEALGTYHNDWLYFIDQT